MRFSSQVFLATIVGFLVGGAMISSGANRRAGGQAVSRMAAAEAYSYVLLSAPAAPGIKLSCSETMSRLRSTAYGPMAEALSMQPQARNELDQGQQFTWSLPEDIDLAVHCTAGKAVWAVSVYKGAKTTWAAFRTASAQSLCAVAVGWSSGACENAFDKTTDRASQLHANKVYADLGHNRSIDYANWPDDHEFTIENTNEPKEMPDQAVLPQLVWVNNAGVPIP